ncbi:MAG: hypothetical protein ABL921_10170, partial [Pirellula sp.]
MTSAQPSPSQSPKKFDELESLLLGDDVRAALDKLLEVAGDDDLRKILVAQLVPLMVQFPHVARGIEPLHRFVCNTRTPANFFVFLDRDRDALPSLLQMLAMDSPAVEWLVDDPDSFDWLRLSAGQAVDGEHLKDTLLNELQHLDEEPQILASMSRFRKRETLRVICAVSLHEMPLDIASQQLSWIADAGVTGALFAAKAECLRERRRPKTANAIENATDYLLILGIGALGGQEMELGSSLDLILLMDAEPIEQQGPYAHDEIQRTVARAIELIRHPQGLGYVVNFRLNELRNSESGSIVLEDDRKWLQVLENQGRTWVRLALMKCRYIAGSPVMANRFLEELPTLVYRRYLTRADIAGIGAVKRKLDREWRDLEPNESQSVSIDTVLCWKHEIESLVEFMQLVYGGELKQIRVANSVQAIDALAQCGCLTEHERSLLRQAYDRFANVIFEFQQQHALGISRETRDLVALPESHELAESWSKVQQIRDHFKSEVFTDNEQVGEESDLVLDPHPKPEWINRILSARGFRRTHEAYQNLKELSEEEVTMLSTQRCRHFLSIIAPKLLAKIALTPDPDLTLDNLTASCRSLGGKGVLWELFSAHEPSLDLYIRLCGASPYLIGLLTSNPGMIDELLDSLMLNRLPNNQQLGFMLHELCRGAEDIEPIVHSFKNARHLNVGARDILGKESIADTHRALSDIAEVCLQQVVDAQYSRLAKRFGVPTDKAGDVCRFSLVALGKLGAREPNYHSDVTLLLLYDSPGVTRPLGAVRHHEPISAEFFFHQLAQKIAQSVNRVGRSGRLYETKNWIVSPERDASLVWQIDEFRKYLIEAPNLAHSRQQLCNARCILGDPTIQRTIQKTIRNILLERTWTLEDDRNALKIRAELQETAGANNLKRGQGGTLDVEYITQLLILRNVHEFPDILVPGTLEQIERLRSANLMDSGDAD